MNRISSTILILLCAWAMACCGGSDDQSGTLLPSGLQLHAGDVVLRLGNSMASHAVTALDSQGEYSHTGIVVDSCGVKMVVHAVPDEPDYEGDPDRVKMEPPEEFFATSRALSGEILRPTDSVAAYGMASSACATVASCSSSLSSAACHFSLSSWNCALCSGMIFSYAAVIASAVFTRTSDENHTCGLSPVFLPPSFAASITIALDCSAALTAHSS